MTPLTVEAAADVIRAEAEPRDHRDLVGIEVEWHVRRVGDPHARVPPAEVRSATAGILTSLAGSLTFEPGGQIEVSSQPESHVGDAISRTEADMRLVRAACAEAGLALVGGGMDPLRPPRRVDTSPRYEAMDAYFRAREGDTTSWGLDMMCNTAAAQVNVSSGNGTGRSRWQVAHALGPVLVASFASSPLRCGTPTGWKSSRQATWAMLDPTRTRPADHTRPPADAWVRYALDAGVMFVQDEAGGCAPPRERMTLAGWIDTGESRRPSRDDVLRHLSTLFPPVRPRGWLEMRMIDMPPPDLWAVPAALVDTLVRAEDMADTVREICRPVSGAWLAAARHGLSHAPLQQAAQACFELALEIAAAADLAAHIAAYHERFVLRGRTPADEMLEAARLAEPAWTR